MILISIMKHYLSTFYQNANAWISHFLPNIWFRIVYNYKVKRYILKGYLTTIDEKSGQNILIGLTNTLTHIGIRNILWLIERSSDVKPHLEAFILT